MPEKISVIVPVRDDPRVQNCIQSLLEQDLDPQEYEIIVVDNGSSDAALVSIIQNLPVRYFAEPLTGSYAARNRGILNAIGSILAFTDADCVVPTTWLRQIRNHLKNGCCTICVGGSFAINRSYVSDCIQAVDDQRWQKLGREQLVNYTDTRNMAAVRSVFDKTIFDDQFQSCGDLDFGLRTHELGEQIHFLPDLNVMHCHPVKFAAAVLRGIRRGRGLSLLQSKRGEFMISGQRPWIIFGKDRKHLLLKLGQRKLFRFFLVLPLAIAILVTALSLGILRILNMRSDASRKLYYFLDRASLLFGRLIG